MQESNRVPTGFRETRAGVRWEREIRPRARCVDRWAMTACHRPWVTRHGQQRCSRRWIDCDNYSTRLALS